MTKEKCKNCEELENTLNLIHGADMRAIKMWHKAHPGQILVYPDRTEMIFWLLEQLEPKDTHDRKEKS